MTAGGYGPGDRVREIDPEGGRADDSWSAGVEAADAPTGFGAHPGAGRGRSLVRSTAGSEATSSASSLHDAPTPTPPLDWAPANERAAGYEAPKKLRGKKALRAHERLLADKRRAEAEAAARAADLEAQGAAGFAQSTSRVSGVSMSNPAYAPFAMYDAGDPKAPTPGKAWYRRLVVIIPAAVVVAAALVVGLGVPAFAQFQATARADRAAAEFTQAIAEYRGAWIADNLDALTAARVSSTIVEAPDPLLQPADAHVRLVEECAVLAETTRAVTALTDNAPPTLTIVPAASFSVAYREAQDLDAALTSERDAANTLILALNETVLPLSTFCSNFQAGIAIQNTAALRQTQELLPLRTVPHGALMDFGFRQVPCDDPAGCVDLRDKSAREQFAATWRDITEAQLVGLAGHYRNACWLEQLRGYCTLMGDAYQHATDGVGAIASSLASEQPSKDPAQPAMPRLAQAVAEQLTAFAGPAQAAALEAGTVDPLVLTDQTPGWETRMLVRLVSAYEARLGAAVAQYVDTVAR